MINRQILCLFFALCLTYPFDLAAYNAECNPTKLNEINEKYTATLLCSSLDPQFFNSCINTLGIVGTAAFLAGMGLGGEATSQLGNAAARADMSRLHNYFSKDLKGLIEKFKARDGGIKETRQIIAELKKNIHDFMRIKSLTFPLG